MGISKILRHPFKSRNALKKTLQENPGDAIVALSGLEGDPLAVESTAKLIAETEKNLDKQLNHSKETERTAEEELKKDSEKIAESAEDAANAANAAGHAGGGGSGGGNSRGSNMADGNSSDAATELVKLLSKGSGGSGSSAGSFGKLLWVWAVIIQSILALQVLGIFQYFLGGDINPLSTFTLQLIAFLSIAIWAFVVFKGKGILNLSDLRNLFFFLGLSAIYIAVPFYSYLIPSGSFLGGPALSAWFPFFFYVVFPIWPLYIANHLGDPQIAKWTHVYVNIMIVILIFVFIFFFSSSLKASTLVSAGGRPEVMQATSVVQFLSDKVVETGKNLWKGMNPTGGIKFLVNASGLSYYTGSVDQNAKAPVGLYINNVRGADKVFYEGSPAIIWADISGKSFNSEIHVSPYCYVDSSSKNRIVGKPSPDHINILGEEHDNLECMFDNLTKGSYSVKVGASFNFETWAYVTYTFVDMELSRAMEVQGKNINSEFNIPTFPEAIYTNGPAMLGMGSQIDQPVAIDVKNNNRDPILGVTIDNQWSEGQIVQVNTFVMQVPSDFELVNCDRWLPETKKAPKESKDGYDYYEFNREDLGDVRSTFSSLTCRIHIKDPAKFLSGQQKVQRTFVTQATYDYKLEKSYSIQVKP